MSARSRSQARTNRRTRPPIATITRALVVLAAFVIGLALGAALDDAPNPGTTTYERTLRFATVTVTSP